MYKLICLLPVLTNAASIPSSSSGMEHPITGWEGTVKNRLRASVKLTYPRAILNGAGGDFSLRDAADRVANLPRGGSATSRAFERAHKNQ